MKFAAAVPVSENKNGLVKVADRLINHPTEPLLAVVVLDASQIITDFVKSNRTPTIRIMHIEPMTDLVMHAQAQALLDRSYMQRTSEQLELPLFNEKLLDSPSEGTWDGVV